MPAFQELKYIINHESLRSFAEKCLLTKEQGWPRISDI